MCAYDVMYTSYRNFIHMKSLFTCPPINVAVSLGCIAAYAKSL